MSERKTVLIEVIDGSMGPSLSIGDDETGHRLAGPKPWGDGRTVHSFKVKASELVRESLSYCPHALAHQWQPIKTAPKDGTEVLAIGDGWESEQRIRYSAPGDGVPPYWEFCESLLSDVVAAADPTHWMPLPEPPEADNE